MVSQSYFREHVRSVSPVVHHYGDSEGNGRGKEAELWIHIVCLIVLDQVALLK